MRARFHVILALLLVAPTLCRAQQTVVAPHPKVFVGVTEDSLHLSDAGYQISTDAMRPIPIEWLGPPATAVTTAHRTKGARSVHE